MKAVAIIPARAGSKGIPDKNMRRLLGKTLVQHSIEHAQASKHVEAVLVSSDSDAILEHAEKLGALPIERPAELATDDAATDPVLVHAVKAAGFEESRWTVLLQPTSPLRKPKDIDRCIAKLKNWGCNSVFTAYDAHFAWKRGFSGFGNSGGEPFLLNCLISERAPRQRMFGNQRVYVENGSIYVTKTERLIATGQRLVSPIEVVEMRKEDSIDIDTPYDLWIAEQRLRWLEEQAA